jgi:hypothetical protein
MPPHLSADIPAIGIVASRCATQTGLRGSGFVPEEFTTLLHFPGPDATGLDESRGRTCDARHRRQSETNPAVALHHGFRRFHHLTDDAPQLSALPFVTLLHDASMIGRVRLSQAAAGHA